MSVSATCAVSRSCTCGRRAYTSTSRASLDRPVIRPSRSRDIADVGDSVEGQQVMLAARHHLDVAHQHHLVVLGLERGGEHLLGVDPQAGEELSVGSGDPCRRSAQTVTVGILADRDQDLPYGLLDPVEVDCGLDARRHRVGR